jgi:O-antigen/teichoic acid export membrane protein
MTTFALFVVAGHGLGPTGLGTVAIAYAMYLVALGFQRALVNDPLIARGTGQGGSNDHETASAFTASLVLGVTAAGSLAASGLLVGGHVRTALLAISPWVAALLVQDLARAVLFRDRRGRFAAAADGIWLAAVVASAPLAVASEQDKVVIACWGVGGVISAAFCVLALGQTFERLRSSLQWWRRRARPLGQWLALGGVIFTACFSATILALSAILGVAALGGLRAAQTVFGPMTLVAPALALPGLPAIVRARARHDGTASQAVLGITGLALAIVVLYVAVASFFADDLLALAFGSAFAGFDDLLLPVAATQLFAAAGVGLVLVLKAQGRGAALVAAWSAGAAVTLVLACIFAAVGGAVGAAWGFAAGSAAEAALLIVFVIGTAARSRRLPAAT